MKQTNLWLMSGIPGSGKSTWLANNITGQKDAIIVSRDAIRFSLLKDGEDYFSHEDEVIRQFFQDINDGLKQGKTVYVDATHLNWASRCKIIKAIQEPDVNIGVIYFNIPLDVCLKRNSYREGRACVPATVIKNMQHSLRDPGMDPYQYSEIKRIEYKQGGNLNGSHFYNF